MLQPVFVNSPLRILLVKTSSLGDVLHNLPVVNDILNHYPNSHIDWLVEENYSSLPKLHPSVENVIRVAIRRWKTSLFNRETLHEISSFRSDLMSRHYDIAIDTQGLIKSALLMRMANGLRCGFDRHSAREPVASIFYHRTFNVPMGLHAVDRNRNLVALSLGYTIDKPADFGIHPPLMERPAWLDEGNFAVLFHATSRADKLWDEANWIAVGQEILKMGIRCILPWGNEFEHQRSLRLSSAISNSICPPHLSLDEAAVLVNYACAVIGVDTGLAHLSAALGVPTIGIYTSTNPDLTGLYPGPRTINMGNMNNAPTSADVMEALVKVLSC